MSDKTQHVPVSASMTAIVQHLTKVTSGEPVAREEGIMELTALVGAPTVEVWLALLLAARVNPPLTRRPVPTVTDEAIPARIEGRIVHVYFSKSLKTGASIAFVMVAAASDPNIIYGPILMYREKDIRCAYVSDEVRTFDIGQPTAEARAARDGGLRANGTMPEND